MPAHHAQTPSEQRNYFASVADSYAAFRPHYPDALFDWLATITPARERAWDCGCGSGQATVGLAPRFAHVDATDFSAEQLALAKPAANVAYAVASAEASGLAEHSVDLVTVAQALHWFDVGSFYAEARRVLRPRGVLAAWSYAMCSIAPELGDAALQSFYTDVVGPYWPAERRHVEDGYRELHFPQPELVAPQLSMELDWTLDELMGYIKSWSATSRYVRTLGSDPLPSLKARLAPLWRDGAQRTRVRWPLLVRATVLNAD